MAIFLSYSVLSDVLDHAAIVEICLSALLALSRYSISKLLILTIVITIGLITRWNDTNRIETAHRATANTTVNLSRLIELHVLLVANMGCKHLICHRKIV